MSPLLQLHPLLRHHIVNSLGFRSLRPLQEAAMGPILAGEDAVLLAPTAGGKTEAVLFPLLSRILNDRRPGLRILYVCPLKALLNNLEVRISNLATLLGLRAGLWHGDITAYRRFRLKEDPPEILLTTPESLEVMLVSRSVDHRALFAPLSAVVVDEVHAFAGDDRGWHLLGVLARIGAVAAQRPNRYGLSATVGNPEQLLSWLSGGAHRGRVVQVGGSVGESDVRLDHVGSLENAATVISRLWRGEKRLVFVDSRARTEELGVALRQRGVNVFLSHGSLGKDERARAEAAFATDRDAVIVATSTLELGIDVGDLDRVIQIDAPGTVASFLQRIGRTGRRGGTRRNCLFLATSDAAFLRAAALIHLWRRGYVEAVTPPPKPWPIFAQQWMALSLQEGRFGRDTWRSCFQDLPVLTQADPADCRALLDFMVQRGFFFNEHGLLSMGEAGESSFGHKHFMELFSVFTTPPLIRVLHGRQEIGIVGDLTFKRAGDEPVFLVLAGRRWETVGVDWNKRIAQVVPGEGKGRAMWLGQSAYLAADFASAVAEVLDESVDLPLTKRGTAALATLRASYAVAQRGAVVDGEEGSVWWNFAGGLYNHAARSALLDLCVSYDDYALRFKVGAEPVRQRLAAFLAEPAPLIAMDEKAMAAFKFSECVPARLLDAMNAARFDLGATHRRVGDDFSAIHGHGVFPRSETGGTLGRQILRPENR